MTSLNHAMDILLCISAEIHTKTDSMRKEVEDNTLSTEELTARLAHILSLVEELETRATK
jgi:hypothetical protein